MQLTLAFTNPANRDRLMFFKDRATLEGILDAPDPVSKVAPLRAKLKQGTLAPGVLAQEPEYFVDLHKQFYLLPVFAVDAREAAQVKTMLSALVAMVEARTNAAIVDNGGAA